MWTSQTAAPESDELLQMISSPAGAATDHWDMFRWVSAPAPVAGVAARSSGRDHRSSDMGRGGSQQASASAADVLRELRSKNSENLVNMFLVHMSTAQLQEVRYLRHGNRWLWVLRISNAEVAVCFY